MLLIIKCIVTHAQIVPGGNLEINNIKAAITADGGLFWNNSTATFEVPSGSGKQTISAGGLWIGGYDAGGNLHVAAQTYRQNGVDFFPGPIDTKNAYNYSYDSTYNRVWKIKKCSIDAYYNFLSGGTIGLNPLIGNGPLHDTAGMQTINSWPAFDMYGAPLAPFYDVNLDGYYDPSVGDVPLIKGDEAVFFVFNDARNPHTESFSQSLGIEIRGMAYAYNCSNDSALANTIFVHYEILNKSGITYDSVFIGAFSDIDIGWYNDDYVACDVARGAYYGYNGNAIDGSGQPSAYGATPPAQGVVLLKGPNAAPNGYDDQCGMLPNETNCGDGITDNEQLGMSRFMTYNNNNNSVNGAPSTADNYYQYLSGSWKNGSAWTFGGDATSQNAPATNFMFPGTSDVVGYSEGGTVSNPITLVDWSEQTSNNLPGDRRGLGSFGPFTLASGGLPNTIDIAYVYARASSGDNLSSITALQSRIDSVRTKFNSAPYNIIPACGCGNLTGIKEQVAVPYFALFPNPATESITLNYKANTNRVTIEIYNTTGQLVKKTDGNFNSEKSISIKDLSSGLYVLKLQDGITNISKKFLKE